MPHFNYSLGSYSLDLLLKTVNGYFIVKDFKDKVITVEDMKQLVDVVKKEFDDDVLRIISLLISS